MNAIPWEDQNAINAAAYVQMGEAHGYKSDQCQAALRLYKGHKAAYVGETADVVTKLPEYLTKGNQGINDGRKIVKKKCGHPIVAPIIDGMKECRECHRVLRAKLDGSGDFCRNLARPDKLHRICKYCACKARNASRVRVRERQIAKAA